MEAIEDILTEAFGDDGKRVFWKIVPWYLVIQFISLALLFSLDLTMVIEEISTESTFQVQEVCHPLFKTLFFRVFVLSCICLNWGATLFLVIVGLVAFSCLLTRRTIISILLGLCSFVATCLDVSVTNTPLDDAYFRVKWKITQMETCIDIQVNPSPRSKFTVSLSQLEEVAIVSQSQRPGLLRTKGCSLILSTRYPSGTKYQELFWQTKKVQNNEDVHRYHRKFVRFLVARFVALEAEGRIRFNGFREP